MTTQPLLETSSSSFIPQPSSFAPLPLPSLPISVRAGTIDDLPFIDALQKKHSKQVGWMPTKTLEGKINAGHVIVASGQLPVAREDEEASSLATSNQQLATMLGYCIGNDRYFKRDDVGIVYQMNVVPSHQRGLVGATLLKALFERSAYGCRLYCCWCAQDIAANRFWEAMGFVPLAFRTGSAGKGRTHIFWQKRIRAGDVSTPWWFPSQTTGGSIREDRLVLPIPPGTHWSDAKPMILPGLSAVEGPGMMRDDTLGATSRGTPRLVSAGVASGSHRSRSTATRGTQPEPVKKSRVIGGGLRFGASAAAHAPVAAKTKREPRANTQRVKQKNDPKLVAAARELRDRWLEQVNAEPMPAIGGKYDVSKTLSTVEVVRATEARKTVKLIEPARAKRLAA